jgi:hypothetical protein
MCTRDTVAPAGVLTAIRGNARRLYHGCLYTITVPEVAALAHLPYRIGVAQYFDPQICFVVLEGKRSCRDDKPSLGHVVRTCHHKIATPCNETCMTPTSQQNIEYLLARSEPYIPTHSIPELWLWLQSLLRRHTNSQPDSHAVVDCTTKVYMNVSRRLAQSNDFPHNKHASGRHMQPRSHGSASSVTSVLP